MIQKLVSIEEMEIKDINDIQKVITRVIYSKYKFKYIDIANEIKKLLLNKGIKESLINSFYINELIVDTIDQLLEESEFLTYNDEFIRNPNKIPVLKFEIDNNTPMVGLLTLEEIEIKDINDIQKVIRLIIYRKNEFTLEEITKEISLILLEKGVREAIVNSYRIKNMIYDTIELLVEENEFLNSDVTYIRNPEKLPTYDKVINGVNKKKSLKNR